MKKPLRDRIQSLVGPLLDDEGIELVELEVKGEGSRRLLRVLIHTPGGVSVEDCRRVSRRIETAVDEKEVFQENTYTLEVASPGLDRPLVTPRDFERRIGEKIRLELEETIEGRKRWKGTIEGVHGDTLQLGRTHTDPLTIPFLSIRRGKIIV